MNNEIKLFLYNKVIEKVLKIKKLYRKELLLNLNFFGNIFFSLFKKYYFYRLKKSLKIFIEYIKKSSDLFEEEINEVRDKKYILKGGFEKRLYIDLIGVSEDNYEDLIYFRENADRYKELLVHQKEDIIKKYFYFVCHKLARDNVFIVGENNKNIILYKILDVEEYKEAVFEKFSEELLELLEAKTKQNMIEEIGDVEDILDLLLKL